MACPLPISGPNIDLVRGGPHTWFTEGDTGDLRSRMDSISGKASEVP